MYGIEIEIEIQRTDKGLHIEELLQRVSIQRCYNKSTWLKSSECIDCISVMYECMSV